MALPVLRLLRRRFHSRSEHAEWLTRVARVHMRRPAEAVRTDKSCAPFFALTDPTADHINFVAVPEGACREGTPEASFIEATWGLSKDQMLSRSVADVQSRYCWFRLSKFYEAVDSLTCDVAYRHTDGQKKGISLVTASHFNSMQLRRTKRERDVTLRCYVTSAGSSSLEVRTDALQKDDAGNEQLTHVCHTAMVAIDNETSRPVKGAVPALVVDGSQLAAERLDIAELHKAHRSESGGAGPRGPRGGRPPPSAPLPLPPRPDRPLPSRRRHDDGAARGDVAPADAAGDGRRARAATRPRQGGRTAGAGRGARALTAHGAPTHELSPHP